jgi:succinoglycan biosynthesis transport protein ExoP
MNLKDYLEVFKRRKWIIILAIVLATFTAWVAASRQRPLYQATVTIAIPMRTDLGYVTGASDSSSPNLEREMQIQILRIQSLPLAEQVAKKLKLGMSPRKLLGMVDAEVLPDASFAFELTVTDSNPLRAAQIANSYGEALNEVNEKADKRELAAVIEPVEKKLAEYEKQMSLLSKEIDAARQQPSGGGDVPFDGNLPANTPVKTEVFARWSSLTSSYDKLVERRDELSLVEMQKDKAPLEIIEAASSSAPLNKNPVRGGLLGLAAGLILGVSAASVLEYMDDTLRTEADIEECFKAPVLASIAVDSRQAQKGGYQLITELEARSRFAEAYKVFRTNIQFMTQDNHVKSLLFANALSQHGRPFVMANLAAALGPMGLKVIVICSNLRKPQLHHFFGVEEKHGLSEWLLSNGEIENVIFDTKIPGVRIIPPGSLPPNPAELLGSTRMEYLIDQLKKRFDFILLDVAPVLDASDAAVLAQKVDSVIIVAAVGELDQNSAAQAHGLLQKVKAPLLGVAVIKKT